MIEIPIRAKGDKGIQINQIEKWQDRLIEASNTQEIAQGDLMAYVKEEIADLTEKVGEMDRLLCANCVDIDRQAENYADLIKRVEALDDRMKIHPTMKDGEFRLEQPKAPEMKNLDPKVVDAVNEHFHELISPEAPESEPRCPYDQKGYCNYPQEIQTRDTEIDRLTADNEDLQAHFTQALDDRDEVYDENERLTRWHQEHYEKFIEQQQTIKRYKETLSDVQGYISKWRRCRERHMDDQETQTGTLLNIEDALSDKEDKT